MNMMGIHIPMSFYVSLMAVNVTKVKIIITRRRKEDQDHLIFMLKVKIFCQNFHDMLAVSKV